MDRGGYPMQAFSALKAAKPPATARGRERQAILIKEAGGVRTRYEWIAKHEWAKSRVCSILKLARYDQWNGYIPPSTDQNSQISNATERRLLVMLTHDVERFERTGELPDHATEAE